MMNRIPAVSSASRGASLQTAVIRLTSSFALLRAALLLVALSSACFFAPLCAASGVGTFSLVGSLTTGRENHTATLLANGKVLVAGGGSISSIALQSAELYDPATGTWTTTGSLNAARQYHTATLLANGKVLVAGGQYSTKLSSAELYDPATGAWTVTGDLITARGNHTATLLKNGTVLVVGGVDATSPLLSAEVYDPATESWTATGSLAAAREFDTATLLANGNVLIAAGVGLTPSFALLSSAEVYEAPYVDAPAKPVNFKGKLKLHHVLLSWVQPDTYATGFVIQRRTKRTAGGYTPWKTQFTLLSGLTQATDKTVKTGVVYEYRIEALNNTVPSAFSAIIKVAVH